MRLLQKIKQAFSSSPGTDSSAYPSGQATHNGKVTSFNRLLPYGLSVLEPIGAFVLLLSTQDQEAVKFGIPSAMQNRLKNLVEGEVAVYNSLTEVYVILKADGTVEINADTTIDGDLVVTGDALISGDLTVTGNATIDGISFNTHVHSGVQTGVGNTGGPQ